MNSRRPSHRTLACLLAAALAAGCGEPETIRTTETLRTEPRPRPVSVDDVRNTLDHMLVAIVPAEEQAWFFKLEVPGSGVETVRKPFDEFIGKLEPAADGKPPKWTLPEGWVEKPASEMRAATIEIPHEGGTLELAVSSLPLGDDWSSFLRMNVNRWMGQLQQPPLPEKKIAELARKLPTKAGEATVIELRGVRERTAGAMPAGHPPIGDPPQSASASPSAGTPPSSEPTPPAGILVGSNPDFKYETPEGWQPGQLNSMRRAAFLIVDGDRQAEMTVMPFPPNPVMSDPVAQAQRWAGQVGLQIDVEELKKLQQPVTIDGVEGQQFELLGASEDKPQGALAAMIARDGQIWFFKMMGDRAVIEAQREPFAKFLQSVEFSREN